MTPTRRLFDTVLALAHGTNPKHTHVAVTVRRGRIDMLPANRPARLRQVTVTRTIAPEEGETAVTAARAARRLRRLGYNAVTSPGPAGTVTRDAKTGEVLA